MSLSSKEGGRGRRGGLKGLLTHGSLLALPSSILFGKRWLSARVEFLAHLKSSYIAGEFFPSPVSILGTLHSELSYTNRRNEGKERKRRAVFFTDGCQVRCGKTSSVIVDLVVRGKLHRSCVPVCPHGHGDIDLFLERVDAIIHIHLDESL